MSNSNPSRPPMDRCIRNQDGSEISRGEYRAIKTSARRLVNKHLTPLKEPSDLAAKNRSKTKSYYQKHHAKPWDETVRNLEENQPLVALCASHWKADHLLGNCLQAIVDDTKKKEGNNEEEVIRLKRPADPQQVEPRPVKKKKHVTKESMVGKGM